MLPFGLRWLRKRPLSCDLVDLVRDAREEVPHAYQVGLALQFAVDGVAGADRRLRLQILEVLPVTALTTGCAQKCHHLSN